MGFGCPVALSLTSQGPFRSRKILGFLFRFFIWNFMFITGEGATPDDATIKKRGIVPQRNIKANWGRWSLIVVSSDVQHPRAAAGEVQLERRLVFSFREEWRVALFRRGQQKHASAVEQRRNPTTADHIYRMRGSHRYNWWFSSGAYLKFKL